MSKLDDVMMNKKLSNVSKMIYSYMFKATEEDDVVLTLDGFKRMYEAVVSGVEDSAEVVFDEMLAAGLFKLHSKDNDETVVYSLVK